MNCTINIFIQGKKLFESSKAQRKYLVTDGVMTRKPNFKHHTVFVQSKGVGARPLFKGTLLLYDVCFSISKYYYITSVHYNVYNMYCIYTRNKLVSPA